MAAPYLSPGVYREERFVVPAAALPTGVPGFVGLGSTENHAPVALHRIDELTDRFQPAPGVSGYLTAAVTGFFQNGGTRCWVVGAGPGGDPAAALITALARLAPVTDLDLVAAPDAMCLADAAGRQQVQRALVTHCTAQGDRLALLDAPGGMDPTGDIAAAFQDWRQRLALTEPENGACYYPWVRIGTATDPVGRLVPPCGHVAGIYARSDARIGVHKAPANEPIDGILDLEYPLDAHSQGKLNPIGINCLRALPGRGLRVYGARTLSLDPTWRYVNVRRVVLTLGRWIDRNLAWVPFEPNTPRLWLRIRRELDGYLGGLWQAGALQGASPAEAFAVKCDAETNPPAGREQGQVVTEIALAPAAPAEFVVVRITHRAGGVTLAA